MQRGIGSTLANAGNEHAVQLHCSVVCLHICDLVDSLTLTPPSPADTRQHSSGSAHLDCMLAVQKPREHEGDCKAAVLGPGWSLVKQTCRLSGTEGCTGSLIITNLVHKTSGGQAAACWSHFLMQLCPIGMSGQLQCITYSCSNAAFSCGKM